MYRAVIEHPEFMPPELKNRPDLNLGKEKGRIWRIVPDDYKSKTPHLDLEKATIAQLVKAIEHDGAWHRTTAQRLLLEHNDKAMIQALIDLSDRTKSQQARILAGWLLEGQKQQGRSLEATVRKKPVSENQFLVWMFNTRYPRVREQALRMVESRLATQARFFDLITSSKNPSSLLGFRWQDDARVTFQLALSLGEADDPRIVEPLARIAMAGSEDKWIRLAIASSLTKHSSEFMKLLLKQEKFTDTVTPGRLALVKEIAALLTLPEAAADLIQPLMNLKGEHRKRWQMAGIDGLPPRSLANFGALAYMGNDDWVPAVKKVQALLAECGKAAGDGNLPLAERLDSIRLLRHHGWSATSRALLPLLTEDPAQEIRLAAVQTLSSFIVSDVPAAIMKNWRAYTPAVRRAVTEAMFRDPARIDYLLKEIEAKRVRPADIDALRTRQLINHKNADIQKRARKVLADNIPADRKDVLARYQKSLELKGDAKNGFEIFKKNCATCHRVAGAGTDVGPDISDTRTKTPGGLLVDILNPNQAIDNNYVNYQVTLKDGKTLSGIITAETASSITLKRAEGQGDVVLRKDIDEIQSSGVSLMPEGLEKTINIQEMADLITFLKNWRYLDGKTPIGP
jgi:putative heme-binding domain-containing protein